MKKYIYTIIVFILLFIYNNKALSQWDWIYPIITGNNLNKIKFVDNNIGFAVGDNGTILKTVNGGLNWITLNSGIKNGLINIKFINSETGYITGTNGKIIKTTNGGANWIILNTNVPSPQYNDIYGIDFFDINIGIAVGEGTGSGGNIILKTVDAGQTWTYNLISEYGYNDDELRDVKYISQNTAIMTGGMIQSGLGSNRIHTYKTTNNGINWTMVDDYLADIGWRISFVDVNTGFVFTNSIGLPSSPHFYADNYMITTNGGNNWVTNNSFSLQTSGAIMDSYMLNSSTGWICTDKGVIKKSLTANSIPPNWFDQYVTGTSYLGFSLNSLTFLDHNEGFSVGGYGFLTKTSNSGNNWFNLNGNTISDHKNLSKVIFINSNTGFAIGGENPSNYQSTDGALMKRTTDGGLTWNVVNINPTQSDIYTDIYFVNQATGYLTSYKGIRRSNDAGLTWNLTGNNTSNPKYSVYFFNENTGFVFGQSELLKTTNGGTSWTWSYYPYVIRSFSFINASTGFGVDANGYWKTTNSGNNWNSFYISGATSYRAISFINETTGFVGTSYNGIYKTINGGSTWSLKLSSNNNNTGYLVNSLLFTNSTQGYATTFGGRIYQTSDAGETWQHFIDITSQNIYSVAFLNSNTGIAVGQGGIIIRTTNGGGIPIAVQNTTYNIPKLFNLYQNFPNPFNASTNIKFDLPTGTVVKIVIYDILGKEVETLLNERKEAGSYSINCNLNSFSSGIYIYKLITNQFSDSKKMILIR